MELHTELKTGDYIEVKIRYGSILTQIKIKVIKKE